MRRIEREPWGVSCKQDRMIDRRTFISLLLRIGNDGKLTYVSKYDVDVGKAFLWWMGMVAL
jgi:hypothetical protein